MLLRSSLSKKTTRSPNRHLPSLVHHLPEVLTRACKCKIIVFVGLTIDEGFPALRSRIPTPMDRSKPRNLQCKTQILSGLSVARLVTASRAWFLQSTLVTSSTRSRLLQLDQHRRAILLPQLYQLLPLRLRPLQLPAFSLVPSPSRLRLLLPRPRRPVPQPLPPLPHHQ
jgi:hypothetical protein